MKKTIRKLPAYRSAGRMPRTKRDRADIEQLAARIQREHYLTQKQMEQRANEWGAYEWALRWHSFQTWGF